MEGLIFVLFVLFVVIIIAIIVVMKNTVHAKGIEILKDLNHQLELQNQELKENYKFILEKNKKLLEDFEYVKLMNESFNTTFEPIYNNTSVSFVYVEYKNGKLFPYIMRKNKETNKHEKLEVTFKRKPKCKE